MHMVEHIAGTTTHRRKGAIKHHFSYDVDFVLIDPEATATGPALFGRNRFNLMAVRDRDHGGPMSKGRGPIWAREVLESHGLTHDGVELRLLTQPSYLGYSFNPVSFWLALRDEALVAVIAEVSTPFGDRHSYLCHARGFAPITAQTRITTQKSLHVSPFQEVAGEYTFHYDIQRDRIAINILHRNGDQGVSASLFGPRAPLTNRVILGASLRRPLGAMRTMALIYWQALRLKLKGAVYRPRPTPPNTEVT